jgi:hypothetical protein
MTARMTLREMLAEWQRGCSCAEPGRPDDCSDCTDAFLDAVTRMATAGPDTPTQIELYAGVLGLCLYEGLEFRESMRLAREVTWRKAQGLANGFGR